MGGKIDRYSRLQQIIVEEMFDAWLLYGSEKDNNDLAMAIAKDHILYRIRKEGLLDEQNGSNTSVVRNT